MIRYLSTMIASTLLMRLQVQNSTRKGGLSSNEENLGSHNTIMPGQKYRVIGYKSSRYLTHHAPLEHDGSNIGMTYILKNYLSPLLIPIVAVVVAVTISVTVAVIVVVPISVPITIIPIVVIIVIIVRLNSTTLHRLGPINHKVIDASSFETIQCREIGHLQPVWHGKHSLCVMRADGSTIHAINSLETVATHALNNAVPDRGSTCNTNNIAIKRFIVRVTHPDTHYDIRCVANSPVISETICSSSFGSNLIRTGNLICAAWRLVGEGQIVVAGEFKSASRLVHEH